MNIFEQYGIKEVSDVTFYAIELNKYDEEVYVPLLYFDTLKVSNIEESTQQAAAKGGLGNPNLIIWDYGKEINLTLEDALFSPASQSLMWGGRFGTKHSKIKGVWNPYVYPKDRFGKQIYLEEIVLEKDDDDTYYYIDDILGKVVYTTEEQILNDGFVKTVCLLTGEIKYSKKVENNSGRYKYIRKDKTVFTDTDQIFGIKSLCPKDKVIHETKESSPLYYYSASFNSSSDETLNEQLKSKKWINGKRPEIAELIVDNFGDFDYIGYKYVPIEDTDNECYFEKVDNKSVGISGCAAESNVTGYIWNKVDLKMISTEGEQDIFYSENVDLRYLVPSDSTNKQVYIARKGLFRKSDTELSKEIYEYTKKDLLFDEENGIIEKSYPYESKVDFYNTIKWNVTLENGEEVIKTTKVKVGTFYIMTDWNLNENTPYDSVHPIEDGMEKTNKIETMLKCVADKTFAIDAESNLAMYNYSMSPKYSEQDLKVYIDPRTMKPFEANSDHFNCQNGDLIEGNLRIIKKDSVYYKWIRTNAKKYTSLGRTIVVDAAHYPKAFKVVGETYIRSRIDNTDERYQFEIPLCKLKSDLNLQLQADGEPTTFNMSLQVLRKEDGEMMRLTKYNIDKDNIVVVDDFAAQMPMPEEYKTYWSKTQSVELEQPEITITNPIDSTAYHLERDLDSPYYRSVPYVEPTSTNLNNLDRSKIVIEEHQNEVKRNTYTEYEDFERTKPTGEVRSEIAEIINHSKVLNPNEYQFEIEEIENEQISSHSDSADLSSLISKEEKTTHIEGKEVDVNEFIF